MVKLGPELTARLDHLLIVGPAVGLTRLTEVRTSLGSPKPEHFREILSKLAAVRDFDLDGLCASASTPTPSSA